MELIAETALLCDLRQRMFSCQQQNESQPEQEELESFAAVLQAKNVPVKLYGSLL